MHLLLADAMVYLASFLAMEQSESKIEYKRNHARVYAISEIDAAMKILAKGSFTIFFLKGDLCYIVLL